MTTFTQSQLDAGQQSIARFHAAIVNADRDGSIRERLRYLELLAEICGQALIGSEPGKSPKIEQYETAIAAKDGDEPVWGQRGRFVVVIEGVPVLVNSSGLGSMWSAFTFQFHAISTKAPFLAPLGYRSHHGSQQFAKTTREAAIDVLQSLAKTELKPMIVLPERTQLQIETLAKLPFVQGALAGLTDPTAPMLQQNLF